MLDKLMAIWREVDARLTVGRAALWACVALIAIGLVQVYETRAVAIPSIFGSAVGWAAGGLCVVVGLIAWAGSLLLTTMEGRHAELQQQQDKLRAYLESRISDLTHDRDDCKEDLHEVRSRLTRAERVLRDNDLDLDPTK